MNTGLIVAIVVVAGLVLVGLWLWNRQREQAAVREHFGPEYERTVRELGTPRQAVDELESRRRRVEKLDIRPLTRDEFDRFSLQWREAQANFVDDPKGAIQEADTLITQLMGVRGYPMTDFEQRAADISVDHPHVVEHYRAAHATLPSWGGRDGDTEDYRQAMVHYRALFDELLVRDTASDRVA
jgi:FtsZ-interacting cell division protein ZipA